MRLGLVLVLLIGSITASAGCTTTNEISGAPVNSGSLIVVDDGNGATVAVTTTKDTGALVGQVFSDAGFGLSEAHVALGGTDNASITNASGWFKFEALPPKAYGIRVDHSGYRAAEATVEIRAAMVTRVNVTLVPRDSVGAGGRPHIHDYWGGETSIVVKDKTVDYKHERNSNPYYGMYRGYSRAANDLDGTACTGLERKQISGSTAQIFFDDSQQTVLPGTRWINISLTWGSTDVIGTDSLFFAWRPPNGTHYGVSPKIGNGKSFSLEIAPSTWDSGHQVFTLWEFYLCLDDRENAGTASGGKTVLGTIHVRMEIARGWPISPEPGHVEFWAEGNSLLILNETKIANGNQVDRDPRQAFWAILPATGILVPPQTSTLTIQVSWKLAPSSTWPTVPPLSISYSPANFPPQERWDATKFTTPTARNKGAEFREYSVEVKPAETDAFYQSRSNWAFLWSFEGHEHDQAYVACECKQTFQVTVYAIRTASS